MGRIAFLISILMVSGCVVMRQVKPRLPQPHEVQGGIMFEFYSPYAKYVNVAGDFNRWCGTQDGVFNPHIGRMYDDGTHGDKKAHDGIWSVVLSLESGSYQYKYVVNGQTWYLDPSNPETVTSGGYQNSLLRVR